MNVLSPQNYIPSNVSSSLDQIEIVLKSIPQEHKELFNQRQSCDVALRFFGKDYLVHHVVLLKSSNLLVPGFTVKSGAKWQIDVKTKGKVLKNTSRERELFSRIISSIYGFSIKIRRCQIHQAYEIAKALQIPSLLKCLYSDLITNFEEYDIFPLLKLGTNQRIEELTEMCYDQLEMEMFEPMRYNKSGLFLCEVELFKNILKRHNSRKFNNQKFGLGVGEIDALINDYCVINGVGEEMKRRLIEEISVHKEKVRNHMPVMQLVRKPSTPQKSSKTTNELPKRSTLTLPRQKQQYDSDSKANNLENFTNIKRLSPCVSEFQFQKTSNQHVRISFCKSNTKDQQLRTYQTSLSSIEKSGISQKSNSLSNTSSESVGKVKKLRKESSGSIQTTENERSLESVSGVIEKENVIKESLCSMKQRASDLMKRVRKQVEESETGSKKLGKYESVLEELKGEILVGKEKVRELEKTVNIMEETNNTLKMKEKFDKLFEVSVALDLTLSQEVSVLKALRL